MSIPFSRYQQEDWGKAGYFRIGHVTLSTPPVDIAANRVANNERLTVLRGQNDMFRKTNQARWDFTIRWVAMLDDTAMDDQGRYRDWEDLRSVYAIFKAAPFVEVENNFIRQVLSEEDPSLKSTRTAFALRQLQVTTHADIVDALDISLSMTLFNYQPYTLDFGYLGKSGNSTDAYLSDVFSNYIEIWKQQHLEGASGTGKDLFDGSPMQGWKNQFPGTLKLRWREYRAEVFQTPIGYDPTALANQVISNATNGTGTVSKAGIVNSGQYDTLIQKYAQKYNVSPAMVKALIAHESNFAAHAVGANLRGGTPQQTINSVTSQLRSTILSSSDGGTSAAVAHQQRYGKYPDLGLMQLNYANFVNSNYSPADLLNPDTNIALGCKFLASYYAAGMTDQTIWKYNTGLGGHYNATEAAYASDVLNKFQKYAVAPMSTSNQLQTAVQNTEIPKPSKPVAPAQNTTPAANGGATLSAEDKQRIAQLALDGWQLDHWVNTAAFFYKEHERTFTDEEHGDIANIYNMYPSQVSIMLVNNLAQIPLASYSYPTYQHIGSPSSKISVSFLSKGERQSETDEPVHSGISALSNICDFLDAQYMRLRNTWRRVDSVHRMQAVYVQNQILNMLGIRGLLIDGISAETMGDTSDLVQVQMVASQYENIFENTGSYKISSISKAASQVTQDIASTGMNNLTPDEANSVKQLSLFAQGRQSASQSTLQTFLTTLAQTKGVPFTSFDSLEKPSVTPDQRASMVAALSSTGWFGSASSYPSYVSRLQSLQQGGKPLSTADVLMIQGIELDFGDQQKWYTTALQTAGNTAATLSSRFTATQIQSVYDAIFPLMVSYNAPFASDVNTLMNSPKYSKQYQDAISVAGPGQDPSNQGHGAYRDFGNFSELTLGGDFNPGLYFYDHSQDYQAIVHSTLGQVVGAQQQTNAVVNAQSNASGYDIAITDNWASQYLDANTLAKMVNIPGYDMAEAFPTFKLFLMEDSSPGLIQAFDNFYSYSSVLNFEVIRYRDKPDVAQIQITNLANILSHKLLDDSTQGKYEASILQQEFVNIAPQSAGASTGGDPNSVIVAGKTSSNEIYQRLVGYNLTDGFDRTKTQRIPLQYIALQPGTKIQIRMGYSDNPDNLTAIFTGRVTDISGDEVLTIEAESYLAELCDIPIKDDKPVSDKNYGGYAFWHDSGDTASVIENLLKCDNAKHFGGFKLSQIPDPLVQGMTWESELGKAIGEYSVGSGNTLTLVGAALTSSYDRSGENILINHVLFKDGTAKKDRGQRSYFDEANFAGWAMTFNYTIPDNCTRTTWDLIRDIARRYPEYIVSCKQYGFPYSADATLVVGHPLNLYFARPPMIGDAETYRAAPELQTEFTQWWNSRGQGLWNATISTIKKESWIFGEPAIPKTPEQFDQALLDLSTRNQDIFGGASSALDRNLLSPRMAALGRALGAALGSAARAIDPNAASGVNEAQRELTALRNDWYAYVQMQNPQASDRLKPVTRTHYIDHQTIIHNGMTLNDKIYNAVRLGKETIKANGEIPSHHTRVIDCTDLCNDPKDNVENHEPFVKAVAQSFLKEEVGKMYRGDIILRSVPEIEPFDRLVLLDPSTAITGIVEVDKVIHSYDQEEGAITIVTPRCVVCINEVASAGTFRMLGQVAAKSLAQFSNLSSSLTNLVSSAGAGVSIQNNTGNLPAVLGVGALAGAAAGAGALTWGGIALFGGPPGWVVDILGLTVLVGGGMLAAYESASENPVLVMPVTRWGRPWMGGLEGYKVSDVWGAIGSQFTAFTAAEIYPLIDVYRTTYGFGSNTLPVQ